MANDCTPITHCMTCGSDNLSLVLDLGDQPLANSYVDDVHDPELKFPLAINVCRDCWHVQLTHAVNPDLMFKDYAYVSGTSKTMHDHCEWFARYAMETYAGHNAFDARSVLDIGCNDGTQLDKFVDMNFSGRLMGFDPAENLYQTVTKDKPYSVVNKYFNTSTVEDELKNDVFNILIAQNVFAHNSDPLDFLEAAYEIMDDASLLFIQTSQSDMIRNGEFDTIYHEHMNFFCINSMNELVNRVNMQLIDVVKCPLHGNSFIFVIARLPEMYISESMDVEPNGVIPVTLGLPSYYKAAHIENLLLMEKNAGLHSFETYQKYSHVCHEAMQKTRDALSSVSDDTLIVGYGAAAKGMTFLNSLGVPVLFDFIIDDNPLKQGKFTPGTHVPIVGPDYLEAIDENRDIVFVPLAWNFFDEIRNRIISRWGMRRMHFLRYFPRVEWVEK